MRVKLAPLTLGLFAGLSLLLIAAKCDSDKEARRESVEFRDQNFARAEAKYPLPAQQNFPLRGLLREYTQRQDLVNHPWFAYYVGENGNVVWYFVSETLPVNICAFLSSTEDVKFDRNGGNIILTAPSLDGIFYGGAGASAACTSVIVKDAATGAMGTIPGDKLLVFDQPLLLDAEPVRIQIQPLPEQ